MKQHCAVALLAVVGLALGACSPSDEAADDASGPPGPSRCAKADLPTTRPGALTVATGEPAYEPWVMANAPESGEGFEAAVVYAVAGELGFEEDEVVWTRTTFDGALAPGPKEFDWNIQQFTITEDRAKAVDFSSSYYVAPQAVITYQDSPIADADSVDDLASAMLGAAVGSTSLEAAQEVVSPQTDVSVFNDNAAAVSALQDEQIEGIVVDLPTAFYLVDAELDDGVMVGQLRVGEGQQADRYGILLAKDSRLTACTSQAVDALRSDGTLDDLASRWLPDITAPTLR